MPKLSEVTNLTNGFFNREAEAAKKRSFSDNALQAFAQSRPVVF